MNKSDNEQSQNEGFHANQPCIDSRNIRQDDKQQNNNKTFQARYIAGAGLIRKQPKQCHLIVSDIPIKQNKFTYHQGAQSEERGEGSAFEVYNNVSEYNLVYSRNKQALSSSCRSAFQNEINLKCFEQSKEDTFKVLKQFDQKCMQQQFADNGLVFDSRFQCGNLLCAYKQKKGQNEYVLFMQNDSNTYGYNQWFYFSLRNAKKNTIYTFKIANYRKSYSFFKLGMKPLVFSLKRARQGSDANGWYRDGHNIRYYKSNFTEEGTTQYYTLQFTLQFEHDNDYITLSPYAPYSYSRLVSSLQNFEAIAAQNDLTWKMKPIAHSLTNTLVPYITVTKNSNKISSKQNIVIIARQHAGQTWSSFLAEELMKQIVEQQSDYSKWLVQNYVLRIFPMVNADGVIYGNFRCDLAGNDLNRAWKNPLQTVHPQVFAIKAQLQKLSDRNGILLCLDLHTHSKEFGAFAYCCVQSEKGREFAMTLSKISPLFRYPACTFGITPQKETTARASIFNLTKNINIITIQLSAFGYRSKLSAYPHMFSPLHVRNIAKSLFYGYHCYQSKIEPQSIEIKNQSAQPISFEEIFQDNVTPILGSDSEPQVDEIQLKVRIQKVFPQQFIEDIFMNGAKKSKKLSTNIKKASNAHQSRPNRSKEPAQSKKNKTPQLVSKIKSNKTETKQPQSYFSIDSIEETVLITPTPANKQPKIEANHDQPLYKKQGKVYPERNAKIEAQRPTKPLNLIQFSLKKLPIMPNEKIKPNMNYVIQDTLPLMGHFSYIQKQQNKNRFDKTFSTYEAMCRPRVRTNSRKVGFSKQKSHKLEQQLPYLCVMSENKKLLHYEKIKDKLSEQQARGTRTFHNSILNSHSHNKQKLQSNKLKNSHKYPNGDLLAKINDQFARYDEAINSKKHRN